jgi:Putative lumazine-binding
MTVAAQETEQITRTINQYVEGVRDGDAAKLREVFHPDARMWGSMLGQRYDEPVTELFKLADSQPADVDGSYQTEITSIEQNDDVALAVLAEKGIWGTVSFIDFFALARIDDTWKIVNKSFVHTGGQPPAE